MEKEFDVAIAGAGPAGSSAAIRLALSGFRVALVEQKTFPRDKLCGEFISPECLSHFEELGVLPSIMSAGGSEIRETVFYSRSGKSFTIENEWFGDAKQFAIGLSRAEMDHLLLERAREVGVIVLEDTSVNIPAIEDGQVIGFNLKSGNGDLNRITARVCLDATGRSRAAARHVEERSKGTTRANRIAFKTHLLGAKLADDACEIYSYRNGYGGCNRVEKDRFNLCFIASARETKLLSSDPSRVLGEIVLSNKRASEVLSAAEAIGPWLAVPIEKSGKRNLVPAPGLITIGDAAAFIDPFTGSGILLAFESAKIAVASLQNLLNGEQLFDQFETSYKKEYAEAMNARIRLSSIMRLSAYAPIIAETLVTALSMSSTARRHLSQATRS